MKLSFRILTLLAVILWLSAITMLAIGMSAPSLSILRIAAIPDAIMALVLTVLAAQKWASGSQ